MNFNVSYTLLLSAQRDSSLFLDFIIIFRGFLNFATYPVVILWLKVHMDWQSQYRWNDSGVYQSLGLNNAILSKSWGGVDRTEYRSADHTGRCCKLTSYLKSKQKWACPIGARAHSPKTLRPGTFDQVNIVKTTGGLSIPAIKECHIEGKLGCGPYIILFCRPYQKMLQADFISEV